MSDNTPLKISPPRFDSDSQSDSETYGEADSMQVLLDGQEFYKIKRSGKPSMRRVSVSQSFHKLFIEKNDSEELKTTAILTSDITSIESGFESRLTPALLKRFFNCRQYGFRIFTRKGSFELSTEYYKIRGVWVRALNKLKELAQQWSSHNGFKTLWATQCTLESLQKDMLQLRNQNARLRMEMADRDIENTSLRKQIVTEALEEVLERILTSKSSREKELERKLSALQLAYNSVKSRQTELKLKRITREQGRGWVFVLSMLNFRELFKLRQLSTKHMDLVHRFLSNRSHWTLLARGGLHPRYVSWPLYIRTFHGHSSVARQQPLTEDTLIEITRDIGRTMSNCKEGIEEVLLRVCGTFEDVGYCQGMNLVVEFLFSVLPSNNQVLGAFMVLMRPPYFFSELWQPGFPRLKLLMFQLNVLLSIKVPTLTRHFSNLDIQLDMLAPSWFLTLFSSIESLPKSVLLRIWDMFWVDGWKAVLSATLTLLHLSQMNVLGHNFERTLQYFSHFEVTLNDFVAFLPMFQVDEPMLESLERAFYLADELIDLESCLTDSPNTFVERVKMTLSGSDWQKQLKLLEIVQNVTTVTQNQTVALVAPELIVVLAGKLDDPRPGIARAASNCIKSLIRSAPAQVGRSLNEVMQGDWQAKRRGFQVLATMYEELKDTSVLESLCFQQPGLRLSLPQMIEARRVAEPPNTVLNRSIQHTRRTSITSSNPTTRTKFDQEKDEESFFLSAFIQKLKGAADFRSKVEAISQVEQEIHSKSNSIKQRHLKPIVEFLNETLPDRNLPVCLSALKMVEDLLCNPELSQAADFSVLVPNCLEKFGDSRIIVRQTTFKVFKQLLKVMEPDKLIQKVLQGLYSPNWHIREEVMHIFLTALLTKRDCDTSALVQPVAMMLDDCKTKVRQTAIETLAVIAQVAKSRGVMEEMQTLLDESMLEQVEDRVRSRVLPEIKDKGIAFRNLRYNLLPSGRTYSQTPRQPSKAFQNNKAAAHRLNLTPIKVQSEQLGKLTLERNFSDENEFAISQTTQSTTSTPAKQKPGRSQPLPPLPVYLKEDEIPELKSPSQSLSLCMNAGGLTEWTDQFQMLNDLRSLIKNHPEELRAEGAIHKIILTVLKWADSLRSTLAKNALIVLGELIQGIGVAADSELDTIISCLMRKSIDTNVFLAEEAEKALFVVCDNCSLARVVSTLLSGAVGTKNSLVKAKTGLCFGRIFRREMSQAAKLKEMDRVLKLLAGYVVDASPNVRTNAKEAMAVVMAGYSHPDAFFKALSRTLNQHDYLEVKQALLRHDVSSPSPKARSTSLQKPRTSQKEPTERTELDEELKKFDLKLTHSDWRKRYETMTELQKFVEANKDSLNPVTQVFKVTDLLAQGMRDPNFKVSVHSLSTFNRLVAVLNNTLTPHLKLAIGLLAQFSTSTNSSVRALADEVWAGLRTHTEVTGLFTAICIHAKTTGPKATQKLVSHVLPMLNAVRLKKPKLIEQYAVPLCAKLKEDECNPAASDLDRALNSLL